MLRRYTLEQTAEKLGLDVSELRFLVHHLREFLSVPVEGQSQRTVSDQDVILLARAYKLHHSEGMDPTAIRLLLRDETAGQGISGRRQAEVLAFTSSRAGTGISSLALNLAVTFNARGFRCTIFDGSTDGGGLWQHLPSATTADNWQVITDAGVRVVWGEGYVDADSTLGLDESVLEEIDESSDFILVDTGEGKSDTALRYAMVVDETIAVTTPDVGANADCFSIVRMLRDVDPDLRLGVVVNRAMDLGDAREAFGRINGAARKLGLGELPGLGWIAEDEAMRRCMANGEAVVDVLPTCASSRCIARLADHLANRLTPVERRRSSGLGALVHALRSARQRGGNSPTLS